MNEPRVDEPCVNAPCAVVVIGVSGSGKTTVALGLAAHYGYVFLDADDFHTAQAKAQMAAGVPLADEQREPWVDGLVRELKALASSGRSCVLAFSGLRAAHRQRLRESGVEMRFVFLDASPVEVAARLEARTGHFMPIALLATQFEALELPEGESDVLRVAVRGSPDEILGRVVEMIDAPGNQLG